MFWESINNLFSSLPGCNDDLLQRLWTDKRLRFDGRNAGDTVDEHNARLVCATLNRGSRLFIGLPDSRPRRPSILFATALICQWLDTRRLGRSDGPVLYFGTNVGIREHLGRTTIQGMQLTLAQVFEQRDLAKGGRVGSLSSQPRLLPQVITVYAPSDPATIITRCKPRWIAIDCGDAPSADWLRPVIETATMQALPIIAWGQNPLSECADEFQKSGDLVSWPPQRNGHAGLEATFTQPTACELQPLFLEGAEVDLFSGLLQNAGRSLAQCVQRAPGPFAKDCTRIHYRYLRTLENLAVPFDFHEVEAPRFWGLKSIAEIRTGCEHFRNAGSELLPELSQAGAELDRAAESLRQADPPLWRALTDLCIEGVPEGQARLITFPSSARKQLFLHALLARCNISEDDLRGLRTWVISLEDLRRWERFKHTRTPADGANFAPDENALWNATLVGVPSPILTPKLLPIILQPRVEVLAHPHQAGALRRLANECASRLNGDVSRLALLLGKLTGQAPPSGGRPPPPRFALKTPAKLRVKEGKRAPTPDGGPMWPACDPVKEVARLLQVDQGLDDEEGAVTDLAEPIAAAAAPEEPTSLWCDEAIEICFDQGLSAKFPPEDQINVILSTPTGTKVEARFVRALKPNDRVLFIDGQPRQSLYDLVISRVHRHPAIELHLALITRWQQDLKMGYDRWRKKAVSDLVELKETRTRDLSGLLQRLHGQDSRITCELTLTFWLNGTTLCPIDLEDMRRVADILGLAFVQQNYRKIDQAASRLRGLHRGLSNRLNRWLESEAAKFSGHDEDDLIDTELGLRFGDIRTSLRILQVRSIQKVKGPFLRENLGKLSKE